MQIRWDILRLYQSRVKGRCWVLAALKLMGRIGFWGREEGCCRGCSRITSFLVTLGRCRMRLVRETLQGCPHLHLHQRPLPAPTALGGSVLTYRVRVSFASFPSCVPPLLRCATLNDECHRSYNMPQAGNPVHRLCTICVVFYCLTAPFNSLEWPSILSLHGWSPVSSASMFNPQHVACRGVSV